MKWKGIVLMLNESDDEWKKNEKKSVCVYVCVAIILFYFRLSQNVINSKCLSWS